MHNSSGILGCFWYTR